uniref:lamin tail domain-containing protein n=1 Tax=Flavobacterium sp. TaxID=239 RepID=UPI00286D7F71
MKKFYTLSLLLALGLSANAQVVISQVYGGGGNTGATYLNDFVELFNRGTVAQSLNGWSVQYTSATGTTWTQKTDLPNVMLQPGQYYLIQEAANAAIGIALPTPDLNGVSTASTPVTGIPMAGGAGKVVLANSTVFVTGANPTDSQVVDKVGYGTTPTGFEGTGPTGTALLSTTSASRNSGGCTDTNNNATDFTSGNVLPRNTATTLNACPPLSIQENAISGLKMYPNPASSSLYITSSNGADKTAVIYNVLGKAVLTSKV